MTTNGDGFAFIVGHRKSGSTWLLNLMSLHPDIEREVVFEYPD